jgi:hypothetical protein
VLPGATGVCSLPLDARASTTGVAPVAPACRARISRPISATPATIRTPTAITTILVDFVLLSDPVLIWLLRSLHRV